jgi:K+-transporting ATPase KdpF subunit
VGMRQSLINSNLLNTMENLIVGIISVGLIIYLIFSIIRPEKF